MLATSAMTAPSIRSRINWLVVYCAVPPVIALAAALLYLVHGGANNLAVPGDPDQMLLWLGFALITFLAGAYTLVQRIAGQIDRAMDSLGDSASRLAAGLPLPRQVHGSAEAGEILLALEKVEVLLRERDAELTRAVRARQHMREERERLQYQAAHDALTGLINRRQFDAVIRQHVAWCDSEGTQLTLLYIDVDGFKRINDEHGHAVGDELLRLFAARLKACVRATDVVARLGGDEFAVVLDHASQAQTLETADTLIDRLSRPYQVGASLLEVSASIGVAAYPTAAASVQALLEAADAAMYRAKDGGKRRHVTSGFAPL